VVFQIPDQIVSLQAAGRISVSPNDLGALNGLCGQGAVRISGHATNNLREEARKKRAGHIRPVRLLV